MAQVERILATDVVNPATLPGAVFYAIVFGVMARIGNAMLQFSMRRIIERRAPGAAERATMLFVGQLAGIGLYAVAVVLYAHWIPPLRAIGTALLTGFSVVSVILGFAAQSTLGNLVAGVGLLLYRPFAPGERLQVSAPGGVETGVVEVITLGHTVLKQDSGRRVIVPNSVMLNQVIVNAGASPAAR